MLAPTLKWEVVGGGRGAKKSPEQKKPKQQPVAKAAAATTNPANQKIDHMRKNLFQKIQKIFKKFKFHFISTN